jgi:peptidoglycan/LPS O-acetylase OafA/YrhL
MRLPGNRRCLVYSRADNGYFAMAAQTEPLLHTWSLSVEWQFYIWMPLVVWLVWRLAGSA